ncbi:hypothetical protein JZO70_18670 [Enterococcus sp. 669A]|uniref:YokE-like PH domain-containing protein n=1 Tax=Candidatus Enterococcus moelleringii TaxID=2815325 RepID=A0ABS3LF01_9ENTE|nr:hypothetical protein [Enterococcus sp. 669A]MBO1308207.1 hypothetical protein [Enterococcus sp. 669A]
MRTYVKIQKDGKETLFYAFLQVKNNCLIITRSAGLWKPLKRVIDLSKVSYLGEDQYYGGKRIIFSYEDEQFAIFESGPAIITDLHNQLSLTNEVINYGKYPRYS